MRARPSAFALVLDLVHVHLVLLDEAVAENSQPVYGCVVVVLRLQLLAVYACVPTHDVGALVALGPARPCACEASYYVQLLRVCFPIALLDGAAKQLQTVQACIIIIILFRLLKPTIDAAQCLASVAFLVLSPVAKIEVINLDFFCKSQ